MRIARAAVAAFCAANFVFNDTAVGHSLLLAAPWLEEQVSRA